MTASDSASILHLEGISKAYKGTPVLSDLSLTANAGQLTVVYGPPASGKSVLMRILTGLETADAGRVILRGTDVTHASPAERNIGYVPQSFALYPHLSVRANIAYPLDLAGAPAAETRDVVADAATMLKIEEHLDKTPDQLSGGQKQRVAIARGIAKRTDLFVLDDPLAGLDFKLREQLVDDLRGLNTATGASVLYVTSDVVEAMTLADELAVLAGGRIIASGLPETLYREPENVGTMALVGFPPANLLRGTLRRRDGQLWCDTALIAFPVTVVDGTGEGDVFVGVRPERLHLSHREFDRVLETERALEFAARVLLREDLGGEDIVYLLAGGTPLTLVDRDHSRRDDLDAEVTIFLYPRNLVLFDAASGRTIGHGAQNAAAGVIAPAVGVIHG
ncbi:MAG: ABC transporter ATP-binding protein [Thermomicrobiales bacterium]